MNLRAGEKKEPAPQRMEGRASAGEGTAEPKPEGGREELGGSRKASAGPQREEV